MDKMRNLVSALLGLLVLAGLVVGLAWLLGPYGARPDQVASPLPTPVSPLPTPTPIEPEPTAPSEDWPTLTPPPTWPPLPTPQGTPVVKPGETPTPAPTRPPVLLTPIPEGTPPSDLTSLYYVADTGSGPELRAIGMDKQGRRWSESELAIGQFPANLVGLHLSPDGRYLALEFIGDGYAEVEIMERSSGRTWCPLGEPARCGGGFWDWTFDNRLLFAPLDAQFGDVIPWGVMVVDLETGQYTQPPDLPTRRSGTSRVQNVTASPDRAVLAYSIVEVEDGKAITEIWTTQFDGGDKQLVCRVKGAINTISWSPAGEQLIYVYQSEPGEFSPAELWLLGTDGGSAGLLATDLPTSCEPRYRPAWSPDGRYVAFTQLDQPIAFFSAFGLARSNMCVVDTITGQITRLSSFENREVTFPNWSPDGRFVAFVSTTAAGEGMPYDETLYSEVWVASADGTQLYAVSGTTRWNYALAWLTPTSVQEE